MAKASREISYIEEQMKDNNLFELWTQKWGVKVYPWYSADKIKFSFIEKGAEGKGKSFEIYMNTQKDGIICFDDWAYDILHDRRFEANMLAEAKSGEKYPVGYKFITGESGEKSIGIANASSGQGYCINAVIPDSKDPSKKIIANIPVRFHDLRKLAERYVRSYESRKEELEQTRRTAEKQITESRLKYANKENPQDIPANKDNSSAKTFAEGKGLEKPKTEEKNAANKSTTTSSTSATADQNPKKEVKLGEGKFKVVRYIGEKNNQYWLEAIDKGGNPYLICITNSIFKNLPPEKQTEFVRRAETDRNFTFNMSYVEATVGGKTVLNCSKI